MKLWNPVFGKVGKFIVYLSFFTVIGMNISDMNFDWDVENVLKLPLLHPFILIFYFLGTSMRNHSLYGEL